MARKVKFEVAVYVPPRFAYTAAEWPGACAWGAHQFIELLKRSIAKNMADEEGCEVSVQIYAFAIPAKREGVAIEINGTYNPEHVNTAGARLNAVALDVALSLPEIPGPVSVWFYEVGASHNRTVPG